MKLLAVLFALVAVANSFDDDSECTKMFIQCCKDHDYKPRELMVNLSKKNIGPKESCVFQCFVEKKGYLMENGEANIEKMNEDLPKYKEQCETSNKCHEYDAVRDALACSNSEPLAHECGYVGAILICMADKGHFQ